MINEREEFLSYINFPEYNSHSKTDNGYLGRFTLEMFVANSHWAITFILL